MTAAALPPVVNAGTWQRQLDALRAREKAATRELDAIAAQRPRLLTAHHSPACGPVYRTVTAQPGWPCFSR